MSWLRGVPGIGLSFYAAVNLSRCGWSSTVLTTGGQLADAKSVQTEVNEEEVDFLDQTPEQFFQGYQPYVKVEGFEVWRRRRPSNTALMKTQAQVEKTHTASAIYEYRALGRIPRSSPDLVLCAWLDMQFRQTWDKHILFTKMVEPAASLNKSLDRSDVQSNVSVDDIVHQRATMLRELHVSPVLYHHGTRYPFPLSHREYVYSVHVRQIRSPHSLTTSISCTSLPSTIPPYSRGLVRVDHYVQRMDLRADKDGGTLIAMHYFDDPKGRIPAFVVDWAARWGVPGFIRGVEKACGVYGKYLMNNT
ncbi:uncharacterized protein SPPG_06121 [Spizellomyces punctatus DAOM BR117]|uniref:START domain-containing protein n=1 Tax=Spizellomyces punctatus (strain DAOM BR117) TaxID=645134 RepID=A0A0L0HB24_SPIPD|nr:uncharacterized protein SPPG_06121 [Spizellomyces punctatus DAOM BR117]KNC98417.1 hypothetical protein SPPG_06121 [Spizellomyces punctatus DAOM BR117]|eukprot:XP_016606457.1 hypothetical protein SPPG_06121 [Spizellomyces punctatus DAOM BR117]